MICYQLNFLNYFSSILHFLIQLLYDKADFKMDNQCMTTHRILIVDDEFAIRDMLNQALSFAGYECLQAENTQQAHSIIVDERPDLVLLDWMLPGGSSGIELCQRLKNDETLTHIPIILISAKGTEDNKIHGLDAGADDYITKPFSMRELLSRIKAVLRRTTIQQQEQQRVECAGLTLDIASQRVFFNQQAIEIGPTEYRLLAFFMTHPERVYTRSQLLDHVWGGNTYIEDRTIDVHIRRLRKVLEPFAVDNLIQTVRGTGYRFSSQIE